MASTGSAEGEKMFQAGAAGKIEELRLLLQGGVGVDAESKVNTVLNRDYVSCHVRELHSNRKEIPP
jgi:hypothetical protein